MLWAIIITTKKLLNQKLVYDNASGEYVIDPDGAGSAKSFSVGNPNFNFKSLRGNAVLRWEAMPGSILYFVWSHDQQNYDDAGEFIFGRDLRNLWKSEGNDVFMVKFSYWLDM
ncbi:MAG: membrane associated [Ignavibacteria bacterium]|nr:MAG: membrane associated [Ignavibacteria bacterium]